MYKYLVSEGKRLTGFVHYPNEMSNEMGAFISSKLFVKDSRENLKKVIGTKFVNIFHSFFFIRF